MKMKDRFAASTTDGTCCKQVIKQVQTVTVVLMAIMTLVGCTPLVFALTETEPAGEALKGIVSVVSLITNIVGIIFVVVGFVRYVMAHAQDDGPSQQKAALFIGTGIALFLVGTIISGMNIWTWYTAPSTIILKPYL